MAHQDPTVSAPASAPPEPLRAVPHGLKSGRGAKRPRSGMHVLSFVREPQPAAELPHGVVRGTTLGRDGRPVYAKGNYQGYYDYRQGGNADGDVRLETLCTKLGSNLFRGKSVLDIGCNSGLISLAVGRQHGASHVLGVDVDADLIEQARSVSAGPGSCTFEFLAADFVTSSGAPAGPFDVILCLSVTKWIHLAHGDWGVEELFRRCRSRLQPGGLFILEPQEWGAYRRKRLLTPAERQKIGGLTLRPDDFGDYLERCLGFERVVVTKPPETVVRGFRRPILVYRRPG